MQKNKSYIGISFVILVFGIWAVPKIVDRFQSNDMVKGDRLNTVSNGEATNAKLIEIGSAPNFELINQDNIKISNESYKGKVFVLEFFFSTCPTICPIMNTNLKTVEEEFFGNKNFGIVSITIDPETDTPEKLKEHAKALGVKSANWNFLTGNKAYIFDLANKGFNLYAGQNEKFDGGFEHSGLFALIDKNGKIRCRKDDYGNPIMYYDGLEAAGIKALKEDIKILLEQ